MNVKAKVYWEQTVSSIREIDKMSDRATMYALRAAGRRVKQVARRNARVYQGVDPRVEKGLLKRSISSSRRMEHVGGMYGITVAPRGKARAYAAKIEDLQPFMQPGHDEAVAAFPELYAKAIESVIRHHSR